MFFLVLKRIYITNVVWRWKRATVAVLLGTWPFGVFAEEAPLGVADVWPIGGHSGFWVGVVGAMGVIAFLAWRLVVRDRKLAETYAKLETAHWDLERRVQLRTAELAEANKLLQQEMYERKQAEKELVRLERLRALSELSAGVSHNLNNLLTGILGPAELIACANDPEKINTYLEMIVRSSQRMAEVVKRLHLSVAIDSPGEMGKTCIEEAIVSTIDMTRPRWKDEAESNGVAIVVETDLAKTPAIYAQEQELRDVLTHLIFNAIEALPEGGTISFKTVFENEQVILTVADTGIGMDESVRARVFDPFFTTKMDVGSGLGLSMVRGTLKRWGATVRVESTLGMGTTFTLALPIWQDEVLAHSQDEQKLDVVPRKRVLVVDDEDVVLRIVESALRAHHEVDVALSGEEALDLFNQKEYDLALIDLGMPGMPGDQVAKIIKERNAQAMTLMVTGWKLDPEDDRLVWFDGLVTKPFETLDALREAVAQIAIAHEEQVQGDDDE